MRLRARKAYDPEAFKGDVMVYRIRGAFFLGATAAVSSVLDRIGEHPKVFVLDTHWRTPARHAPP